MAQDLHGWIMSFRSSSTGNLIADNPRAFVLLSVVAIRAGRTAGRHDPRDLSPGEVPIDGHQARGMTHGKSRLALMHLEKSGFVASRPTSQGTIARLVNSTVSAAMRRRRTSIPTTGPPPSNHRPTNSRLVRRMVRRARMPKTTMTALRFAPRRAMSHL